MLKFNRSINKSFPLSFKISNTVSIDKYNSHKQMAFGVLNL